eukprot:CAMPEP_0171191584 /NCGR_PEP_ID=MMETSP0790-20130122/19437_1 /TAXON_ID=2925 /ORGANISM="Alexandrium catenella, Strain OF101" /LENGTH=151 /DNA_ID=CAMNT_0011656731 /DNA_START=21 /DNA_END=473 /DNA_ORIENTATION=+
MQGTSYTTTADPPPPREAPSGARAGRAEGEGFPEKPGSLAELAGGGHPRQATNRPDSPVEAAAENARIEELPIDADLLKGGVAMDPPASGLPPASGPAARGPPEGCRATRIGGAARLPRLMWPAALSRPLQTTSTGTKAICPLGDCAERRR